MFREYGKEKYASERLQDNLTFQKPNLQLKEKKGRGDNF